MRLMGKVSRMKDWNMAIVGAAVAVVAVVVIATVGAPLAARAGGPGPRLHTARAVAMVSAPQPKPTASPVSATNGGASAGAGSDTMSSVNTIVTTGTGTMFVAADMATVSFKALGSGPTATDAENTVGRIMNRAKRTLRGLGIPNTAIQTSDANLWPAATGYQATQTLQVILHKIDGIGPVVDAGVKAGATHDVVISYGLSDANPVHQEILQNAALDAKTRAQTIATAIARNIDLAHVHVWTGDEQDSRVSVAVPPPNLGPLPLKPSTLFDGTLRASIQVTLTYTF